MLFNNLILRLAYYNIYYLYKFSFQKNVRELFCKLLIKNIRII